MSSEQSVTRKITSTEYKYKIITVGSKLGIPTGAAIKVRINSSKDYDAKTHSKVEGRIDGLSKFYKENYLQVGDEITISYDSVKNRVQIDCPSVVGLDSVFKVVYNQPFEGFESTNIESNTLYGEPDHKSEELNFPVFGRSEYTNKESDNTSEEVKISSKTISTSTKKQGKPKKTKHKEKEVYTDLNKSTDNKVIHDCDVKVENLGIIDSDTWRNLPYQAYFPNYSPTDYSAASNDIYVTILTEKYLYLEHTRVFVLYAFNRNTKRCNNITFKFDKKMDKEFTGHLWKSRIIGGSLYWTDDRKVYKTSLIDGNTVEIYKLDRRNPFTSKIDDIYDGLEHFKVQGIFCTNVRYNKEDHHTRTKIINLSDWAIGVEMLDISAKYGNIIGTGPDGVILNDSPLDFTDCTIHTFYTNETKSLFDYTFENPVYDCIRNNKKAKKLFGYHIYAVDLRTHTVVIREYPELELQGYREGSLIKIEEDKIYRLNNIYRGEKQQDMHEYIDEIYKDCNGHEVTINAGYRIAYRNPDGTVVELFDTSGSCVPEQFVVTDNHTAIVKLSESQVAIVDFAENKRYMIDIDK